MRKIGSSRSTYAAVIVIASFLGGCGSGTSEGGSEIPSGGSEAGSGEAMPGASNHAPAAGAGVDGGGAAGLTGGGPDTGAGSGEAGAGAEAGAVGAPTADAASSQPTLPAVTSVDEDGPFKTTQDLAGGPQGASGVFYPTELGMNGLKHPIFLWGCGGGSTPSQYVDHMNRIASHGFVAIAEVSTTAADGATLKASMDWIINENDRQQSIFYHKLDTGKIALGGHSIGSVNAFAIADDPRLTTTIHVAGGSLDGKGSGGMKLTHPAAYICSEQDVFGNVAKTQADYDATTVPVFFTVMTGVDHVAAATAGLPAIVAWLRWHLAGETQRRSMFLDPAGEFCTGIFVSKSKNW